MKMNEYLYHYTSIETSEQEYIIVQALLEKYCANVNVKLSKSRIRVR